MHAGADPLGAPSSFSRRRSATSQLPTFTLPQPQLSNFNPKYQAYSAGTSQPPMNHNGLASVGNLLTPPNTLPGDCNPLSPGAQSNASSSGNVQSYSQNSYWSASAQQQPQYGPYNGPSGAQQQQPQQQSPQPGSQQQPWIPSRGLFSPTSLNGIVRDGSNPQQHHQQSEYNQLPPFSQTMSLSTPSSLPTMTEQPQYTTHTSPVTSQEPFHMRQQYAGNHFSNQHSPLSAGSHQSRLSPLSSSHDMASPYQRPYGQYPLPHSNGAMLSGMQQQHQGQMGMVSPMSNGMLTPGFGSGHATSLQHMYGMQHSQQQQPANDRPFKCDQCMQSFNRNHDLKRHKRIHLAVKPYPCGHCDKSFSRKDALKRHILVKGCGKGLMVEETEKRSESSSASPVSARSDQGHLSSPALTAPR